MKALLAGHWEKLVAALGLALLGASLFLNLVPGGPPPAVGVSDGLVKDLQDKEKGAQGEVLTAPQTAQEVAEALARRPGAFPIPRGLVNYGSAPSEEVKTLLVDEEKVCDVKLMSGWEVTGDAEVAEVTKIDAEHVSVKARKPGTMTVRMNLNGKETGNLKIRVQAKSRIELWPPVLQKPAPNPAQPGEVSLSWTDDRRTAPQATLGYVLERRSPPGSGEFKPLPSLAGRMLPPSMKSWTDEVEPNARYEYRIRAVGDPGVTHVMPE